MVGKTRLYQRTGSPLIQGSSRARRPVWPWIIIVVVIVALLVGGWMLFVR
jgi:hypothetical protein